MGNKSLSTATPPPDRPQRICIIGAGAAGLAALKTFKDAPQFKDGSWELTAYESREDLGGIWLPAPPVDNPPLTPLYDSLTTNLPHPLMGFPSHLFPPETPLFPPGSTVLNYLRSYASVFDLWPFIHLNTTVSEATWDDSKQQWRVKTAKTSHSLRPDETVENEESFFDLLIVGNGHYRLPRYPKVPGLEAWLDAGKVSHSAWYRHAHYMGDTVLVAGAGPSGQDLTREMRTVCKVLIHSMPNAQGQANTDDTTSGLGILKTRPRIASFGSVETGEITFVDGTSERGIDHALLATGYDMDFAFLPPTVVRLASPAPLVPPFPEDLYNTRNHLFPLARHLFPIQEHYPPHRIAFLGLLLRVAPFPVVEAQSRVAARVFADPTAWLDLEKEKQLVLERQNELLELNHGSQALVARTWHQILTSAEQFEYRRQLDRLVGNDTSQVREWEEFIFDNKVILRTAWQRLEKSGEASEWLKGVGRGEDPWAEWVDMMKRLLKKAKEEGWDEQGVRARPEEVL